jgi:hypothetical protein
MLSCSTRLDWQDAFQRFLNWITIRHFSLWGLVLLAYAVCGAFHFNGYQVVEAVQWAVGYATGYGADHQCVSTWDRLFTVVWMIVCSVYYGSLLAAVTTWLAEYFRR